MRKNMQKRASSYGVKKPLGLIALLCSANKIHKVYKLQHICNSVWLRCLNQTSPGEGRTEDRSFETRTKQSRGRLRAPCTGGSTSICRFLSFCAYILYDIYIYTPFCVCRTYRESRWEHTCALPATKSHPLSANGLPSSLSVSLFHFYRNLLVNFENYFFCII